MSCPLFEPTERLPWRRWEGRFLPPLGAPHAGLCHAGEVPTAAPDADLLDCCNLGYARGRCGRFSGTGPDAWRFTIAREDAGSVEIAWLAERDCLPAAQGLAVYDRRSGRWLDADRREPILQSQLEAFLRTVA